MSAKTRKPILSLIAAAILTAAIAAPADAQRGRGGGGDHNRGDGNRGGGGDHNRGGGGGNWNRGDNDRDDWNRGRRDNDWNLSFSFGSPFYSSYDFYRPYYRYSPGISIYTTPGWSNAYGLGPYECRVDYEFGYWYGRPADIEVRRCADAYGSVYVVQGSQRLWRYR